jgi:SAM-dependent methyltransferase
MSISRAFAKYRNRILPSLRTRGLAGTIRRTGEVLGASIRNRWLMWHLVGPWHRRLDRRFDRRFGVDTAGIVNLPELDTDPRFRGAVQYGPSQAGVYARAMRVLGINPRGFLFVDFGCGKGKAVMMAARQSFRQVIGVELSSVLALAAEENVHRHATLTDTQKASVRILCMDAREFAIPAEPAVFYFFNPFTEEVMSGVLENIRRSFVECPRECYVVYCYPVCRALLDDAAFLTPLKQTALYSIYVVGERAR